MAETPAERMHNRILNGTWFSTQDVSAAAFRKVARKSGTMALPDVRQALERLEAIEKASVK